jgi:simple sugar transport system substrate-binding protein
MKSRRWLVLAAVLMLVGAACDGGEEGQGTEESPRAVTQRDFSFSMVIHSEPAGTYWGVVKNGAEDAARDLGVSLNMQGSDDPAEQADLFEAAIATGVDGIAVTFAAPDAMRDPMGRAIEAGIPVIGLDSGINDWQELGALGFVGQDEFIAGQGAGQRLNESGLSKVICAIHEVANVALDERCRGVEDTFEGEVVRLQIDINDPVAAQASIKSALEADSEIDSILTLNPDMATISALPAIQEVGREVALATFDLGPDVLTALENGEMLFAIDAQPYLQGYLPVAFLVLYLENLNTVGGGLSVLTGPGFVTAENAATVADLVNEGTR